MALCGLNEWLYFFFSHHRKVLGELTEPFDFRNIDVWESCPQQSALLCLRLGLEKMTDRWHNVQHGEVAVDVSYVRRKFLSHFTGEVNAN